MAVTATVRQSSTAEISQALWGSRTREHFLDQDLQLIERCLNGEEAAWEDLVKLHTRRVYAICYRFTGSDHQAQDLTQDVFLRDFSFAEEFPGRGRLVHGLADPADAEPADRSLPA